MQTTLYDLLEVKLCRNCEKIGVLKNTVPCSIHDAVTLCEVEGCNNKAKPQGVFTFASEEDEGDCDEEHPLCEEHQKSSQQPN